VKRFFHPQYIAFLSLIAVLLVLSVAPRATAQGGGEAWPMHGHDAQRTGRTTVSGPLSPTLKWSLDLAGTRTQDNGSPIVGSDGTIYVGGASKLYAINPNGTVKWSYPVFMYSAPALSPDESAIYGINRQTGLYIVALSTVDGSELWQYHPTDLDRNMTYSSFAVGNDGTIYFGNWQPALYALNPNGTLKWRYEHPTIGAIETPPVIDSVGNIYFFKNNDAIVSLDSSGSLRWEDVGESVMSNWPTLTIGPDDTIYTGAFAFNPDGTPQWTRSDFGHKYLDGTALSADGSTLYYADSGVVYGLNTANGNTLWSNTIAGTDEGFGGSPVLSGDGILYIMGDTPNSNNNVYAVSAFDATLLWQYQLNSEEMYWGPQSPAIGPDGTLYVLASGNYGFGSSTQPARLYAFNTTTSAQSDLIIAMSDAPDPVVPGSDVTYTVTVTNDGPDSASNVTLTDALPSSVTFVSSTPGSPTCAQTGGVVTCDLGTLAASASAELTIVVTTTTAGAITNRASVTANVTDPDISNNTTSVNTIVGTAPPPAATNDLLSDALVVSSLPYSFSEDINNSTISGTDPVTSCAANYRNSVWFRFTPTSSASFNIDTTDSQYDTVLAVYVGTEGSLTQVGCDDDSGTGSLSQLTFTGTAGTAYSILIAKWGISPVNSATTLMLNIAAAPPLLAPTLIAPDDGAQLDDPTPTFSWDAVAGAANYEMQLRRGGDWVTVYLGVATTMTPAADLLTTDYEWRVRVLDANDNLSEWSNVRDFTITAPADAVPQQNLNTSGDITLTWNRITWAQRYQIQVARDANFTQIVYQNSNVSASTLEIALTDLESGAYFWHVRARRVDSTWGAWSQTEVFTVAIP
jgi:uncharacterized repeat protein (TIGR01451 family)